MKKKFICPICGYVHEGEEAPERCPQCKQIVEWKVVDESTPLKDKAFTISHQRNACIPAAIDPMIAIIADPGAPEELRLKSAEALGWYTHSFRRQEIYSRLKELTVTDSAVADEVYRTLRRLEDNAHTK